MYQKQPIKARALPEKLFLSNMIKLFNRKEVVYKVSNITI
jgi:hypothetical protein